MFDFNKAVELAKRREFLCKKAASCPSCGADQVQLVLWTRERPVWKCRVCKYSWEGDGV